MEKKVNMLTYNFENIGSDTLYEYLYKCIKNDIIQGKIKSGEKLPSKRALAKNLAISVITVENAYGQLAAEGYIYSVPKSGFYVADLRDDRMKSESGLSENRIYSNKLNLTGGKNAYIADFTSNQTEQSAFPFSIWTKTMRAVMNDYQTELMLNPPCGNGIKTKHCGLSESIPKHDGAAGTDHYWCWNRIFVQSFDSAFGKGIEIFS